MPALFTVTVSESDAPARAAAVKKAPVNVLVFETPMLVSAVVNEPVAVLPSWTPVDDDETLLSVVTPPKVPVRVAVAAPLLVRL